MRAAGRRLPLLLSVLLAVAVSGGLAIFVRSRGHSVAVFPVTRTELVQTVVATGRVATLARVELGALAPGVVSEVRVREGDRAAAGEVLVTLRSSEARAGVAQAEAALERARTSELSARLAVEQARSAAERAAAAAERVERVDAPSAERAVSIAREEKEIARRQYERSEKLHEAGILAQADLDEATRATRVAAERYEQQKILAESSRAGGSGYKEAAAALRQARDAEELARAGEREAAARLREAGASLQAARSRLEDLALRAPASGTVVLRQVEAGDAVQPGRVLLALSLPGKTEVVCSFDEKNLPFLRAGQRARVNADAYPGSPFDGVVSTVVPSVSAATGTVTVRVAVPEPPAFLLPDMTVSAEVETARRPGALTLSADAVRDLFGSPWVLAARGGVARRVPLTVGVRGKDRVEVVSGLREGDLALSAAETAVAEGDRVRPERTH